MPRLDNIVCNCADCGDEIVVKDGGGRTIGVVHRIKGRPYCRQCVATRQLTPRLAVDTGAKHDADFHGGRFHSGEW